MKGLKAIAGLRLARRARKADVEELRRAGEGKPFPTDVDARIAAWMPTPQEKRFDEIGWAKDIRTALRLARENRRPVFLFTMDGRVNTGRC